MSVLAGLRSDSAVQFLETARALEKYTIQNTVKLPKRYVAPIDSILIDLSVQIYSDVQTANDKKPRTKEDLENRTVYLRRALINLRKLASQLDLAYELAPESQDENAGILKGYAALIATETRLVNGVINSDAETYKNLKSKDES